MPDGSLVGFATLRSEGARGERARQAIGRALRGVVANEQRVVFASEFLGSQERAASERVYLREVEGSRRGLFVIAVTRQRNRGGYGRENHQLSYSAGHARIDALVRK